MQNKNKGSDTEVQEDRSLVSVYPYNVTTDAILHQPEIRREMPTE